jgi:transposase
MRGKFSRLFGVFCRSCHCAFPEIWYTFSMLELHDLPNDLQACQQMLLDLSAANARLQQIHEELVATCTSMQESQEKLEQEKVDLELTIKNLMNRLYGQRSERLKFDADQLNLDFGEEDPVVVVPDVTEDEEFVEQHEEKKKKRRRKRKKRSGRFPEHLERRRKRIEPSLPKGLRPEDCELLGVDTVEHLEFEPPKLWVEVLEYPKYKIPTESEKPIVQADRVPSLIPGGSFGFGIGAQVLYNKFALHVPLYRQQDPFAELGWAPNRSTLCQIVSNSAELLRPLAMLQSDLVLSSSVLNTDDTEVKLLTPGQGKGSKTARLWIYRSNAEHARYNVFAFTTSRERAGPDDFLQPFHGTICGDCYSGYVNIETVTDGRIAFSACNAHARRYVYNAREQCPQISSEIEALYHLLYDIEERASRLDPVERLLLRRRESVPLMKRIEEVINGTVAMKLLPKSKLGQAVGYMRNNWLALKRFLSDGELPIDNNEAERDLRRVSIGRKNWLFVGSEEGGERTAIILTIVASAHRHDLDVWAYLRDVLERLANGEDNLKELLPDVWKAKHPEHVRNFRTEEREQRAEERRYRRAKQRIQLVKSMT